MHESNNLSTERFLPASCSHTRLAAGGRYLHNAVLEGLGSAAAAAGELNARYFDIMYEVCSWLYIYTGCAF